jgi:hypothetical protein
MVEFAWSSEDTMVSTSWLVYINRIAEKERRALGGGMKRLQLSDRAIACSFRGVAGVEAGPSKPRP